MLESILFCDLCSCLCVDCTAVSLRPPDLVRPGHEMSMSMSMSMSTSTFTSPRQAILCPLRASSSHESTTLTYPVALEAILTAEVGLFPKLLAGRALQAASIFIAVCTLAFALLVDSDFFCWCLVHDCGLILGYGVGREIRDVRSQQEYKRYSCSSCRSARMLFWLKCGSA